ncbi:hypothetical protein COCC4DRAFT_150884, partial [Bipolaris maydis ATCC 48331]
IPIPSHPIPSHPILSTALTRPASETYPETPNPLFSPRHPTDRCPSRLPRRRLMDPFFACRIVVQRLQHMSILTYTQHSLPSPCPPLFGFACLCLCLSAVPTDVAMAPPAIFFVRTAVRKYARIVMYPGTTALGVGSHAQTCTACLPHWSPFPCTRRWRLPLPALALTNHSSHLHIHHPSQPLASPSAAYIALPYSRFRPSTLHHVANNLPGPA